jgi:hypothetical protein
MISTDGLRPFVEKLDREVARLLRSGADHEATTAVAASWATLCDFLALGPPPDLGTCPFCGGVGMRAATRCGQCWRSLVPYAPATSE